MAKEWFADYSPQVVDALRLIDKAARPTAFRDEDGKERPHFPHDRVARFYRWASRDAKSMEWATEALTAWLTKRPKAKLNAQSRSLETGFLRALVLVYVEHHRMVESVAESRVAHAGDFMGRLAAKRETRRFVMNLVLDSEERGDPTAVIRGVLLSANFAEHADVPAFWDEAAETGDKFPLRVFMDPCPAAEGYFFTPFQVRCFARHFRMMSDRARGRFASYMADNALVARTFVTVVDANGVETRKEIRVPVDEHTRLMTLRAISADQPAMVREHLEELFDL